MLRNNSFFDSQSTHANGMTNVNEAAPMMLKKDERSDQAKGIGAQPKEGVGWNKQNK